jgi:TRAP-type uncharacterized transport system fused permease subunit
VALTNLGLSLSQTLIEVSGGNPFILLLLAALGSIVLGMGMPIAATYIMLAILIVPALTEIGINPMASHLFLNFFAAMSFVTPPVCVAAFVAAGIAECPPMKCGWTATRLGIAAYIVPFAFCFSPALMLQGSLPEIIAVVIPATIGVVFLAVGLGGYLYAHMSYLFRGLAIAGGLLMMTPELYTSLIGVVINAFILAVQWKKGKLRNEAVA